MLAIFKSIRRIFNGRYCPSTASWYLRLTNRANKHRTSIGWFEWIENRLSPILVAFCAYQMRRFGFLHGFFQCISNTSRVPGLTSFPRFYQFITILLCFPCFYAGDFFFKCAYFLNHRRLIRVGRKCAALGGQNGALKLNNLTLDVGGRFKIIEALRDVTSELETGNRALYESYIHLDSPLCANVKGEQPGHQTLTKKRDGFRSARPVCSADLLILQEFFNSHPDVLGNFL